MTGSRRALALDFGRVLTLDQDTSVFEGLLGPLGIPLADFRRAWATRRLDYDRGDLDTLAYWTGVLGPDLAHRTQEFAEADFRSWCRPRTGLHQIVRKALDRGMPTALVSNMPPGIGERFTVEWPWLAEVSYRFFSGDFGVTKPDEGFYSHVLKTTGWVPSEVLFVDDMPVNIEAAGRLGFQTLLFTGDAGDLETVARWCGIT